MSRGFGHARGFNTHVKHPQKIISYVLLLSSVINVRGTRSAVRGIRMRDRA
jgi:hypothetical protein